MKRRWLALATIGVLIACPLPGRADEIRAKVLSVDKERLVIDAGSEAGIAAGDTGEIFYQFRTPRGVSTVTVASIKIEEVTTTTSVARIVLRKTEAQIQPGYEAKISTGRREEAERIAREKQEAERERQRAVEEREGAERERQRTEAERRRAEEERRLAAEAEERMKRSRRAGEIPPIAQREEQGMMRIDGGVFGLGADDADADARDTERPQHEVTVRQFWIDKHEVSNDRFRRFINGGGYRRPEGWDREGWAWRGQAQASAPRYWGDPRWSDPFQPVVGVTWHEARAFCRFEGKRLPTEQEWELAARGWDHRKYPWGNRWERDRASTAQGGTDRPRPVGYFPQGASPFGALDMAGNVWEWTESTFAPYPGGAASPEYGGGESRVTRGGGWNSNPFDARATGRQGRTPDFRSNSLGFRCAKD